MLTYRGKSIGRPVTYFLCKGIIADSGMKIHHDRGYSLLEVLVALAVACTFYPVLMSEWIRARTTASNNITKLATMIKTHSTIRENKFSTIQWRGSTGDLVSDFHSSVPKKIIRTVQQRDRKIYLVEFSVPGKPRKVAASFIVRQD